MAQVASGTSALKSAADAGKPSPAGSLQMLLTKHKDQLVKAAPTHLRADRIIRLAITAFNGNKTLQACNPNSVLASIMTATQMGLEIGVAGQGYLVPYKGKCTFVPGWQGLVDLVSRSGRATVWTGAVFEGDFFEWEMGCTPKLVHRPAGEDDPTKLLYTYAVGWVKGGEYPVIDVWTNARLIAHRNKYNKVGAMHYSYDNWEMYARKIPLLQVIKYLPKSIELQNALAVDTAAEQGLNVTIDGDFVVQNAEEDEDQTQGPGEQQQAPTQEEVKPDAKVKEAEQAAQLKAGYRKLVREGGGLIGETDIKDADLTVGLVMELGDGVKARVVSFNATEVVVAKAK